jgi:hypothetical protein
MLSSTYTHHSEENIPHAARFGPGYKWIHVAMNGGRATEEFGSLTAKSGMVTNGQVEFEYLA